MFSKQPGSEERKLPDHSSHSTIKQIRPVKVEPLQNYEAPTITNGSVIGTDLTILGENLKIVSRETLQIDGEIHGDVSGKRINISTSGMVVGTISAETVEIDGGVSGTVRAQEVRLNADAKVSGELLHASLIIKEGAEFEGRVHRAKDPATLIPDLEIAPSQATAAPQALEAPAAPASVAAPTTRVEG